MGEKTVVNFEIQETVINHEVGQATEINYDVINKENGVNMLGTLLGGKYQVEKKLQTLAGEADLYVCKYNGEEYVAKIYRRKRAIKPKVIAALKSIDSPYVAQLFDTGEYNGSPFEILPYYKNGSLQGKKFNMAQLKNMIIPCMNEALRVLHQNDIIHKDLKPSNIMLLDHNKSVAIIDFGISSVVEQGNTVLLTETGMTPAYSAPETFRGLFLEESDYYSFGITLYELFCGYTPYKNMSAEKIAQFTTVQRIPFPRNMPRELQDLIAGLTYFDITNRNKKENPNRRWTYEEVEKWCKGEKQIRPGEGFEVKEKVMPTYTFLRKKYTDVPSLIRALASNWEDGKKQLYRGLMSAFFKSFNPEIAGYCMDAENEIMQVNSDENIIFWNTLYKMYPENEEFYWMGQIYSSLFELGQDMLRRLWKGDVSNYAYWDSVLKNKLISRYFLRTKESNETSVKMAAALETSNELKNKSERDRLMNYYAVAYLLCKDKVLKIENKQFKEIKELVQYMRELLDSSYLKFKEFCHNLIDYDDTLNIQFEAWLIAMGKRKELDEWKKELTK